MQNINVLGDFDLKGKRVLVRVDLNVPVSQGKIVDTARIERIIPTVEYLIEQDAKVILISHFGRPKGKYNTDLSLAPIVDALNGFLPNDNPAKFSVDCIGTSAKAAVEGLNEGDVLLLENLRFYPGEEANEIEFTQELASLGDVFINDTFSCSHRAHASISGLAAILPSGIGLLFQEELSNIEASLTSPEKPFAAIVGGSKVSTKLSLLESLVEKSDLLVIGGGMANTFLKAEGVAIGKSLCEDDLLETAKEISAKAKKHNCKIIIPRDAIVAEKLENPEHCEVVDIDDVPEDKMILDVGPLTVAEIIQELQNCKTIVWNGPLGAFEFRPFNVATESVARAVAGFTRKEILVSIAGGGDVVAALKHSGLKESFTYLSTAGGAFLEWLEGKVSPGIKALQDNYTELEKLKAS